MTRERSASSLARPPALRMTCASPSLSPAYFAGSRRASMQVRMTNPRAGGRPSFCFSPKLSAYLALAARTSSRVFGFVSPFLVCRSRTGEAPAWRAPQTGTRRDSLREYRFAEIGQPRGQVGLVTDTAAKHAEPMTGVPCCYCEARIKMIRVEHKTTSMHTRFLHDDGSFRQIDRGQCKTPTLSC